MITMIWEIDGQKLLQIVAIMMILGGDEDIFSAAVVSCVVATATGEAVLLMLVLPDYGRQ